MAGKRSRNVKKKRQSSGKLKRFFLISVLILCIITVIGIGYLIYMYAESEKQVQEMDINETLIINGEEVQRLNLKKLELSSTTLVYYIDEKGNARQMEEIYDDGNRIYVESGEISQIMKDAIVAIEDERFYEHNGVDMKRTMGAFFGWIKAKFTGGEASYGGSTITQQVIKNITNEKDKTAGRKIKEMLMAIALEKEYTKDEILTMYLNIIYLSNGCYGVEAAANMYYSKSADELTLNEAATIAGITQYPSYYNPLKNPDNAKYKRDVVLTKMCELGMIDVEERDETIAKGLELDDNYATTHEKVFSYFTDNLLNEVVEDLQKELGYSRDMAEDLVYSGGLSIYSTVDPKIQTIVEDFYENKNNFPNIKKEAQSAMIIMDPYTGEIKGMVGGIGRKTTSRGLNRATQSRLQPGSAIKPLSVYGPAIEEDLINSTTGVLDAYLEVDEWSPKNAYSGYKGTMSVKRAVQVSSNTTSVRVLQQLSVGKSYEYLTEKFGITSLSESDKNLSPLALGGLTNGITPEEMAAAYSVFANGGIYIKPHSYTKVIDRSGNVLLENSSDGKRVIKESTAFIITDILGTVVTGASGTGRLAKLSAMPAYGKTGTTQENRDKWFVGYTPYYVGAVWYGFDQPDSISKYGVTSNVSAKVWGQVMEKIHEDLRVKEFDAPDSVIKKGNDYFYVNSELKREYHYDGNDENKDPEDEEETENSGENSENPGEESENSEEENDNNENDSSSNNTTNDDKNQNKDGNDEPISLD